MFYKKNKIFVKIVGPETTGSDLFECLVQPENTETLKLDRKELTG
jgi:hypothetical protein